MIRKGQGQQERPKGSCLGCDLPQSRGCPKASRAEIEKRRKSKEIFVATGSESRCGEGCSPANSSGNKERDQMTSQSLRVCSLTACVAALTLAGCSMNGGTTPAPGSNAGSQVQRGAAHYMLSRSAAAKQQVGAIPDITLKYFGGPVLIRPKMYLIFWNFKKYGDPDKVAKLLKSYCTVVGGSGHDNIYTQYYEMVGGSTIYIKNPKNQCGGWWYDEKDVIPQNPTDAQVAQEAQAGVGHFGYNSSGSYVVALPPGRYTQGFGTQWCSYHSAAYFGSRLVSYTNLPYIPSAGENCRAGSVPPPKDERRIDEGVTIIEGKEYGASITDPDPGSGWYNFAYGEIGDICSFTFDGNANEAYDLFRNKVYATLAMFSNATQSCVQEYK
jgi:hypothetical protein